MSSRSAATASGVPGGAPSSSATKAPSKASRRRSWPVLRADLQSGLTVALVGLPQCLAYAMMAGVPPAYGLVTAAVPGAVATITGRAPNVSTGPTNTTGLLILAAMGPWLGQDGLITASGLPVLAALTLLAGLIRLAATLVGGHRLMRFFPLSVLGGFTAGAGALIMFNQLDEALGLPAVAGGNVVDEITSLGHMIASGVFPAWPAVAVTAATVVAIVVGRRLRPRWPVALVMVGLAAGLAYALGWDASVGLPVVADRAVVPQGWPEVALPELRLETLRQLGLPAAAIALLGTLELTVTVRAADAHADLKQEIRGQGWANLVGAFTGAFPASASLTRSAMLRLGGAKTRRAALLSAITILPLIFVGADVVNAIPLASLAGVLLVTAARMANRARIRRLWGAGHETRTLLLVTFIGTLILPLEWAILGGAALAVAIHLHNTSEPRIRVYGLADGRPAPLDQEDSLVVVEVSGDLHYAAVPAFVAEVRQLIPPGARRVIIDLDHAHEVRFLAVRSLESLAEELTARGASLVLAGIDPGTARVIRGTRSALPYELEEWSPGASVRRCAERLDRERASGRPPPLVPAPAVAPAAPALPTEATDPPEPSES